MMTLDEAIRHAEEAVCTATSPACAEDHRMLAMWLRELRARRAADAHGHLPGSYGELKARFERQLRALLGLPGEMALRAIIAAMYLWSRRP